MAPAIPRRIALATLLAGAAAAAEPAGVHLGVTARGIHRVTVAELRAAGLPAGVAPARLGLTTGGAPVPILVTGGDDGVLDDADTVVFLGDLCRRRDGETDDAVDQNVYTLRWDGRGGPRWPRRPPPAGAPSATETRGRARFEEDRLLPRFPGGEDRPEELWYWVKLSHLDPQPWRQPLALPDLDPQAPGQVRITVALRGLSRGGADGASDHTVRVLLGDRIVAEEAWTGSAPRRVELPGVSPRELATGQATLGLQVPHRRLPGGQDVVDVVMVDAIDVDYPRRAAVPRQAQAEIRLPDGFPGGVVALARRGDGAVEAFSSREVLGVRTAEGSVAVDVVPGDGSFHVVAGDAYLRPDFVEKFVTGGIPDPPRQVDYVMIAHPRLLDAVEALAEIHRRRGLGVLLVDVRDVYTAHGDGLPHPRAIRAFLADARECWPRPGPRFVLLAGDASWDPRAGDAEADDADYANWTLSEHEVAGRRFRRMEAAAPGGPRNARNLIPAFDYGSEEGHAASDNWYVAPEGGFHPTMAIGRLPVVEPREVADVVDKVLRHLDAAAADRSRELCWIADATEPFRSQSDRLAAGMEALGYASEKIYPAPEDPSLEGHRDRLRAALARGPFAVHFIGHGGRFIWRTAPADLREQRDLFTLDDVDALPRRGTLPFVLSMTCYSAPFDHPSADSIGERFLLSPGRGAVAVVGASWRNSPSLKLSRSLLREMTAPGATIGEALRRAKQGIQRRDLVELYTLLGDPALPVLAPPPREATGAEPRRRAGAPSSEPSPSAIDAPLEIPRRPGNGAPGASPTRNRFHWTTASESDNFGFDVYRSESPDGPFERITREPIRGAGTTDAPRRYTYVDDGIDPAKAYYYYVESISLAGVRERFTPVFKLAPKAPPPAEAPLPAGAP